MILRLFWAVAPFAFLAAAQDIETVVKEVQIESDSKKLAQARALGELSRELVEEMIGKEKYQEDREKIERYIIKSQNRYILSIQPSEPVLEDSGGFSFSVAVKFSRENLKSLLLEHNLFYASKSSFCLFPAISFVSYSAGKKESWSWWLKKEGPAPDVLKPMAGSFFDSLSEELVKAGFYALHPVFQRMSEGTPSSLLPKKGFRVKNFAPLAEFYNCDIVLSGFVQTGELGGEHYIKNLFSPFKGREEELSDPQSWTRFSFNVFNIKTRQFLFQLKKRFPFSSSGEADPTKEMRARLEDVLGSLSYQLSSYQEEGSLDLSQLTISVQGPLSYSQKERLKKALMEKIPDIQNLEERLLSSSRAVYSAESSKSASDIAKRIKKLKLRDFVIQVKGHKKRQLEIYAKTRER